MLHLAGAVLIDVHDEWQAAERCYFSDAPMAKLDDRDDGPVFTGALVPADWRPPGIVTSIPSPRRDAIA